MSENDRLAPDPAAKEEGAGHQSISDLEWEQRTLCSDESCIGVIGPNGHCKVCGKPLEGSQVAQSGQVDEPVAETQAMSADAAESAQDVDEFEETSEADIDWEKRILCRDESCIGVIGPAGRCKECGKPYEGE